MSKLVEASYTHFQKNRQQTGKEFERFVYRRVKKELASVLGLNGAKLKFRQGPRYYSKDRDTEIQFDISAELFGAHSKRAAITVVIECKAYKKRIPVDDVEEFKAKLDQCFGKNVKGVMAISGSAQEGAIKYAMSHGIAIVRIFPREQLGIIAFKVAPGVKPDELAAYYRSGAKKNVMGALTNNRFRGLASEHFVLDVFGMYKNAKYVALSDLLRRLIGAKLTARR